MFWSKKKEPKEIKTCVDLGEVVATIHLHGGLTLTESTHGLSFDGWYKKADRELWIYRHVKNGMVHLKDRSIPLTEIKEITFTTQSFFKET